MSKKKTETFLLPLTKVKPNSQNPRIIKDVRFRQLKKSIQEFPEMLEARPLVIDEDNIILGGNMRYEALKALKIKEVKVQQVFGWTEEQKREFVIKDNANFGEWDLDALANEFEVSILNDWGLELQLALEDGASDDFEEEPEVTFSEVLGESMNYVVLTFENDIDWLAAQTHFGLDSVYSKRANGKAWSKGVGRVLKGADYLDKINNNQ